MEKREGGIVYIRYGNVKFMAQLLKLPGQEYFVIGVNNLLSLPVLICNQFFMVSVTGLLQ